MPSAVVSVVSLLDVGHVLESELAINPFARTVNSTALNASNASFEEQTIGSAGSFDVRVAALVESALFFRTRFVCKVTSGRRSRLFSMFRLVPQFLDRIENWPLPSHAKHEIRVSAIF